MKDTFDILSLDGGGTWALIQARVLSERYGSQTRGHEILKKFDLVAANSGGSLVLAMLIANKTVQQIVDTFNNPKILSSIFYPKKIIAHTPVLNTILPIYETKPKLKVFIDNLNTNISYGTKYLHELPKLIGEGAPHFLITTFEYDRQRAVYFRSNPESKMESAFIESVTNPLSPPTDKFKAVTLAHAVHASSNAPVQFFDDPAEVPLTHANSANSKKSTRLFWDGAVAGNNNPVKVAVLEALANGNRQELLEKIRVVSIGTSATVLPILYNEHAEPQPEFEWLARQSKIDGIVGDIKRIATAILGDPPDAASFDAHQILGFPLKQNDPRFIRINPMIKPILRPRNAAGPEIWTMPGTKDNWCPQEMYDLFNLDMAVSNKYGLSLINRLCDDFFRDAFENQGIRSGGKTISAILGHKTYNAAMQDWRTW